MNTTSLIEENAVVVKLFIGGWKGEKNDKATASKVTTDSHAKRSAGRFIKRLVANEHHATFYKMVSQIRTFHLDATLPWLDTGLRLLPVEAMDNYNKEMASMRVKAMKAAKLFVADYTGVREKAREELGLLFREEDYPSSERLGSRFAVDVRFLPVPNPATDFRCKVSAESRDALIAQGEEAMRTVVKSVATDLWERVVENAELLLERVEDPDRSLQERLVGRVKATLASMETLNVLNDTELNDMLKQFKDVLKPDIESIRGDTVVRGATLKGLKELSKTARSKAGMPSRENEKKKANVAKADKKAAAVEKVAAQKGAAPKKKPVAKLVKQPRKKGNQSPVSTTGGSGSSVADETAPVDSYVPASDVSEADIDRGEQAAS